MLARDQLPRWRFTIREPECSPSPTKARLDSTLFLGPTCPWGHFL